MPFVLTLVSEFAAGGLWHGRRQVAQLAPHALLRGRDRGRGFRHPGSRVSAFGSNPGRRVRPGTGATAGQYEVNG